MFFCFLMLVSPIYFHLPSSLEKQTLLVNSLLLFVLWRIKGCFLRYMYLMHISSNFG